MPVLSAVQVMTDLLLAGGVHLAITDIRGSVAPSVISVTFLRFGVLA